MNNRLFHLFVVNLGMAIIYAIQKKIAWRVADWVDDTVLQIRHEREMERRMRPYPKPKKKNFYYRDDPDWE